MLVKNWMSTGVMSIRANESLLKAFKLQKEHNAKILPVVENGKLVGIVTKGDLKKASLPEAIPLDISGALFLTEKVMIRDVMTPYVITTFPDATIEEVAGIILSNDISGLPVVDTEKRIIGLITKNDILRALMAVTTTDKPGYEIAFKIEDQPGSVGEIVRIIRKNNGRISYVLASSAGAKAGFRNAYMKIFDVSPEALTDILDQIKEKSTLRYVIDNYMDKREIFEQ